MPISLLRYTPSLGWTPLLRRGLNNSRPSTKSRKLWSRRLLLRSLTRNANLCWTMTPVLRRFPVFCTSGKIPKENDVFVLHGSKKLTAMQAKYGASKLELYAAYHFIVKNHSYLCPRKFTLKVAKHSRGWKHIPPIRRSLDWSLNNGTWKSTSASNAAREHSFAMPRDYRNGPATIVGENNSCKSYQL